MAQAVAIEKPRQAEPYRPRHPVRLITAAALFDGHDAAINIMRRLLQASGAEIVHLGHNRSVAEIVAAALQEDAQGVAITSYQGGHVEFFTYLRQLLDERGARHVRIYGGGGGVIVPAEIEELHARGIDRIFSPEDGRRMGLQGMIDAVLAGCDYDPGELAVPPEAEAFQRLAREITLVELGRRRPVIAWASAREARAAGATQAAAVVGLTGTGGAGKSSLTDELVLRFVQDFPERRVAVLCVDPTKRRSGGALLGDRIRFNTARHPRVYLRSLATRGARGEVSEALRDALATVQESGLFDLVFLETAGIGQGDSAVVDLCDLSLYVMTAEFGAPSQLEKIEMLDYADLVAINKFTRRGSEDALRAVRKQFQRNHRLFDVAAETLPVFGTSAAHFHDPGVNALYAHLIDRLVERLELPWTSHFQPGPERTTDSGQYVIPAQRERYLSEISERCRAYRRWAEEQAEIAAELEGIERATAILERRGNASDGSSRGAQRRSDLGVEIATGPSGPRDDGSVVAELRAERDRLQVRLDPACRRLLAEWPQWEAAYRADHYRYEVRGREVVVDNYRQTLSDTPVPKVARPRYRSAGDRLLWRLLENVPGEFPFTGGVFPFKRTQEDPTRMFAGEGPAERTNRRFHYLADGQPAKRLSTAFDSITLYGEDPDWRPDIYGKIGESGVSVCTVEEAEQLYAGFDLCDPTTSVSMTINGPAPTVLAFFFTTAIRQQCRRFLRQQGRLDIGEEECLHPDHRRGSSWEDVRALLADDEYARVAAATLKQVRGTVQADILKEDQGQNTCIFSIEFALRMMGDVQQFFIDRQVRNFYSVSISGYHIAEAGANPIHQLAFTLANGFTYVELYRARGMSVDDFAPNLSFFFSNGMDSEYSVIGRVARRVWAVAVRDLYGGNERSQKLKYHIQTSGRSLHSMEIELNDIRTTLQALLATFDNAQSLHTNAYDEAITTPTEESVRRAMAIQLIINQEFGLSFCENATQGSFVVEELTDLVEQAVLGEFDRISERGGVLGAMELQYQRGQIQDDSLKYEMLKHSGELPVVGVNTFLPHSKEEASPIREVQLSRASTAEKEACIARLQAFQQRHAAAAAGAQSRLQQAATAGGNLFAALMEAVEHCSLGQITHALYAVGGEYRRNI
ncbi:MAG TPA: methylmalonyl-CoA mutase family protein [Thermoanaerobaculia bacterium]|nr:methylmalonyl-CoA mutase family protein [Thermoanaerobaculia bacterium]